MRKWKNNYERQSGCMKILKAIKNHFFKIECIDAKGVSFKANIRELDPLTHKAVEEFMLDNNINEWDVDSSGKVLFILDGNLFKGGIIHYDKSEKGEKVRINHIRAEGITIKRVIKNESVISAAKNLISSSSVILQELAHESEETGDFVFWNLSKYSFNSKEIKLFVEPLIDYGFCEVVPKRVGVALKSYL